MRARDIFYAGTCIMFWVYLFLVSYPVTCPDGQFGLAVGSQGYICVPYVRWRDTENGKRALGDHG